MKQVEVEKWTIEDTSAATLQVSPEGAKRFQDAAFGMSVHWGLYSISMSGHEWIYFKDKIPYETYRKRMERFNPNRFDAEEWADLMVEANQKLLLITSKHHDGFCLWDTEYTDFKATNSAFGRDIIGELSAALKERDIALHFYYSLVDWTHPAYRTDWPKYVEYYQNQLRELCTNYGEIGGFLFDGYCPTFIFEGDEVEYFCARGEWDLSGTYNLIHELQPNAVVVNNTQLPPANGEDYQVWEQDIPGENTKGYNITGIGDKTPACWSNLNAGWSYQPWNHKVKSADEILETYIKTRANDGVLLLNVGPRRFGDIHPEEQQVLREVGQKVRALNL